MKTVILICLLLAVAVGHTAELKTTKPERQGMSSAALERVVALHERYTSTGKIPGTVTAIVRNGEIVHTSASGVKGINDPRPIEVDDLFRIYSMTKPIAAVAAMQLYERGMFQLSDPVAKFVPELKDLEVLKDGVRVPATQTMTMQHLLSHTAGFSYGFNTNDPVDQAYGEANLWAAEDLDEFARELAKLPLMFEPGERWHYSVAVDVTGLVVQRLSGQPFDDYLREHIFEPLGMRDTFFAVPESQAHRLLPLHYLHPQTGEVHEFDPELPVLPGFRGCYALCEFREVTLFSGGGGLVSTLRDYVRFAEAMRDGELNGVRILGPKTVDYMRRNHLPSASTGQILSGEQPRAGREANSGFGFGLGFGIVTDAVANGALGSDGEYYWGGAAGTVFWIDPVEDLVVVSLMQLIGGWPSYRPELRVATYQAISDLND